MARQPSTMRRHGMLAAWLVIYLGIGSAGSTQAAGYLGLDGSSHKVENTLDDDLQPGGLRLRLGMPLAPMLDVEFHIGGGRESRTSAADRFSTAYAGAFLKGYLPVGRRSALYGMVGLSAVDFTQTLNGRDFTDDRSGFSWGFGLETELSRRLDLSADYVHYVNDDGPFSELSSVSLGLKLYF